MPARRGPAPATHVAPETPTELGCKPPPAAELRGRDSRGNVRPADNRYLTEPEIGARDAYVAEETGEDAQQLIVKREAPEHVEALNSRDRTED